MEFTAVEIWLAVGIIFILAEFTTIPGIGLLFIGLGSLSTSILIYYVPEFATYQIASVGLTSLAWFLVLWWPLKIFVYGRGGNKEADYFDMVGMQVKVVEKNLEPDNIGLVSWSGTIMNARLDDKENSVAKIGAHLYIVEVKGNVAICTRKKP